MKLKLSFALAILILFSEANGAQSAILSPEKVIVRPNIIVSATIGIPKMTIWGYGPPQSLVELSGIGVDQNTNSGANGYYSFDLVYLPNTSNFPELCITAIDSERRVTPPTCIPPIGSGNYFFNVGPVILPPTISIGAPETNLGSEVSTQGKTIPNSTVEIKLARPEIKKGVLGFQLVRQVLAYYIPNYTIISDTDGNYSFNMPTNDSTTWRVFAITKYTDGNKSPKSNTLKFETLSQGRYLWESFWTYMKTFLVWPRILLLQLLIILVLVAITLIVIRKRKRDGKKTIISQNDQKYSNIVERYQELLRSKKVNQN